MCVCVCVCCHLCMWLYLSLSIRIAPFHLHEWSAHDISRASMTRRKYSKETEHTSISSYRFLVQRKRLNEILYFIFILFLYYYYCCFFLSLSNAKIKRTVQPKINRNKNQPITNTHLHYSHIRIYYYTVLRKWQRII